MLAFRTIEGIEPGNMIVRLAWLFCLWAASAGFAVCAEPTRVIYFNQPLLIENVDGKAVGPVADLARTLFAGLPDIEEPSYLSVKRVEKALVSEKAIGLALARSPRREASGLVWVLELYAEDFRFATLAGHPGIHELEDARSLQRIGANLSSAPADFLIDHGFTNLENAPFKAQAEKLHAGRIDAWFDRPGIILDLWKSWGFPPDELRWSAAFPAPAVWLVASPKVDPALIEAIKERYARLKREGKLNAVLTEVR